MLPGAGKETWNASVNEENQEHLIESNAILLDVLRDQVGTLGVKRGCDMGTCGCCAVLIDGEPRLSCLCLAKEAQGTGWGGILEEPGRVQSPHKLLMLWRK